MVLYTFILENPIFGKEKLDELVTREDDNSDVRPFNDTFIEQYCRQVFIVLQAANETERVAIFSKLEPPILDDVTRSEKVLRFFASFEGKTCHGEYSLGIFGGYKVALVQTDQGEKCRPLIEATIDLFPNVYLIIGVGVAYGGNKDKTRLGDVLVSEKIAELYTVKFRNDGSIISRGITGEVIGELHTHFCRGNNRFNNRFKCSESRHSTAHVGTIISGSFLVDNEEIKRKLWDNSIEAIGGEMEGHFLMDIIKQRKNCPIKAIIIKGVCDYGDGMKSKEWQVTAALAAVEYTHFRLNRTNGTLLAPRKLHLLYMHTCMHTHTQTCSTHTCTHTNIHIHTHTNHVMYSNHIHELMVFISCVMGMNGYCRELQYDTT